MLLEILAGSAVGWTHTNTRISTYWWADRQAVDNNQMDVFSIWKWGRNRGNRWPASEFSWVLYSSADIDWNGFFSSSSSSGPLISLAVVKSILYLKPGHFFEWSLELFFLVNTKESPYCKNYWPVRPFNGSHFPMLLAVQERAAQGWYTAALATFLLLFFSIWKLVAWLQLSYGIWYFYFDIGR